MRKELIGHFLSVRLLIIGLLFLASLIVITIVLPLSAFDHIDQPPEPGQVAHENAAMALFLNVPILGGYFLIQVLAIVMTADGVCSEWQRKTVFLVLSKPVPRSAFVLGKYCGAVLPLMAVFTVAILFDYLLLQGVFAGSPDAEEVGRFFAGVAFILLGIAAFGAMGLFFSSLTKTTLTSVFATFAAGFLVLPLVGAIGEFTLWADESAAQQSGIFEGPDYPDRDDFKYDWSRYFSPSFMMIKASDIISDGEFDFGLAFLVPQGTPTHWWASLLSGLGLTAAFLGGALKVVQRRNFE